MSLRGDGRLEQSELLVDEDADAARGAVAAASVTTYAPSCPDPMEEELNQSAYVVMFSGGTRMEVSWEGSVCRDRGVFINTRERCELTADVVHWALCPGWSGGMDGGVPLPTQLRR